MIVKSSWLRRRRIWNRAYSELLPAWSVSCIYSCSSKCTRRLVFSACFPWILFYASIQGIKSRGCVFSWAISTRRNEVAREQQQRNLHESSHVLFRGNSVFLRRARWTWQKLWRVFSDRWGHTRSCFLTPCMVANKQVYIDLYSATPFPPFGRTNT